MNRSRRAGTFDPGEVTRDETAGSRSERSGDSSRKEAEIRRRLADRMGRVRHKLVVLSGKGGVGKSTVAVNLAVALSRLHPDRRVGLLDIDLHGPSVPMMLHLQDRTITGTPGGLEPVRYAERLSVMSIGFLLRHPNDAVIWRGPLKYGAIRQFLGDVDWGELEILVIDSPPGTGDEPLAVCQLLAGGEEGGAGSRDRGAVIVTTPQNVAIADVEKCVTFCRRVGMPIHGVIENMSHLVCPHCHETVHVFPSGGGERMARERDVPFLGSIPLDPAIVASGEVGRPFVETEGDSASASGGTVMISSFDAIARAVEARVAASLGERGTRVPGTRA